MSTTPGPTTLRAVVVGAAGYVGGELCRLLLGHPSLRLVAATSKSQEGERLDAVHRHLRGATDLTFAPEQQETVAEADVVFLALPHKQSMAAVIALRGRLDAKDPPLLVDLSGDFRLADPETYAEAYGAEHLAPELLPSFVYGLPELGPREWLPGRRRISAPGCFATCAALAAGPLAASGRVRGTIVIDGVTGASGSGAQPQEGTHFPMREGNFRAYKVLSHQHEPEVLQTLRRVHAARSCLSNPPGGLPEAPFRLVLTTHSAPLTRGIHVTATAELGSEEDTAAVREEYERTYRPTRFVRLQDEPVELKGLAGTNYCDLFAATRGRHVVVTAALDNLVKGAAGQAVQAANLALGLDEAAGLTFGGLTP